MSEPKDVWCVQYRSEAGHAKQWCAVGDNREPEEVEFNVHTTCNHYVILPLGIEKRQPTCGECLEKLAAVTSGRRE